MLHGDYNFYFLIASVIIAIVTCFVALSIDIFLRKNKNFQKLEKIIWVISGLILGLAIWLMHFIGMMGGHFPEHYYFDTRLTILSYVVAAIASILAIWLNSHATLPFSRLIIGSILMGAGIAGMHYIGMLSLNVPGYKVVYNPFIVILSIVAGISGALFAFWMKFKTRATGHNVLIIRFIVAVVLALSIVLLHYIGMIAVQFIEISNADVLNEYMNNQKFVLFVLIFIISMVLISGLFVAKLELRLDEKELQLKNLNQNLADLALQDHLTKLPNRFYLDQYADQIFANHRKNHQQVAFIYIDVDHFKMINDVFGHYVGDQLLLVIVERIKKLINNRTQLMHLGGDEFLLVVEQSCLNEAIHITENLLYLVKQRYLIADKDIKASLSIGIAMYPEHGENLTQLLINADMAMFLSKEQGRNTFRVYTTGMDAERIKSDYTLTHDLKMAIEEKQFTLFYQPKFDQNYQIKGVEALIRWSHPVKGQISPLQFIDLAEKTGLIIPIGYWVIEEACRQIQDWKSSKQFFSPIAVNLSARQFEHPDLISTIKTLFKKYQILPEDLIIEITENTVLNSVELNQKTFQYLKQMGIKISIDDFGTGYSSFAYLKDFTFDELKIDREFVHHLTPHSKEEAILESIIQLAIKLGLQVIAEGVETQEQADILLRLGCHQLQGFLLAKPMPANQLRQLRLA